MKVRHAVVSVAVLALLVGAAMAGGKLLSLKDGGPQTSVDMLNVDGQKLSIRDVVGEKGTLVIFTCNACPWVKAWQERIVEIGNTYSKEGVGVIAINPNDPGRVAEDGYDVMQERAEEHGMEFPYVVDATSDVARAFDAKRTPETFLFDGAGNLVYHGTIDDNAKEPGKVQEQYLRDALEALLAGEEIAVKETKALGCTIKFR